MRRSGSRGLALGGAVLGGAVVLAVMGAGPVGAQDQVPEPLPITGVAAELVDNELQVTINFAGPVAPELSTDDGRVYPTTVIVELHTDGDCTAVGQADLFASDGFAFPAAFFTGESCPPDVVDFPLEAELHGDLSSVTLCFGPVPTIDDFLETSLRAVTLVNGPDGPAITSLPEFAVRDGGSTAVDTTTDATDPEDAGDVEDAGPAGQVTGGETGADLDDTTEPDQAAASDAAGTGNSDQAEQTQDFDADVGGADRGQEGSEDSGGGNGALIGATVVIGVLAIGTTYYLVRRRTDTGEEVLGEEVTEAEAASVESQLRGQLVAESLDEGAIGYQPPPPGTDSNDVTDEQLAAYESYLDAKVQKIDAGGTTDTDGVSHSDETIVVGDATTSAAAVTEAAETEAAETEAAATNEGPAELVDEPLDTYVLGEHGVMQPPSTPVAPQVQLAGPVIQLSLINERGSPDSAHVTRDDQFVVRLKLPRTDDLPRYLDVTVSAGGSSEPLTLETTGGVGANVTYTSAPISVADGGEGMKVVFPLLDITTGGIGSIDARAGDTFAITFASPDQDDQRDDGEAGVSTSSLSVAVHPSWVQRERAYLRDQIVLTRDAYTLLVEEISDLPEDDEVGRQVRQSSNQRQAIAAEVLTYIDDPNRSDVERLAAARIGFEYIQRGFIYNPRYTGPYRGHVQKEATALEDDLNRGQRRQWQTGLFHALVAPTPAPTVVMVFDGNDLLSDPHRPRTGESWERVNTAVSAVSWAIVGGYVGSPGSPRPSPARAGSGRPRTGPRLTPWRDAAARARGSRSAPASGPVVPPRQPSTPPVPARRPGSAAPAAGAVRQPGAGAAVDAPEPVVMLADPELIELSRRMPRLDGVMDVYIHGNRVNGFWYETAIAPDGTSLGFYIPETIVAEAIRKTPGYRPGMPVRLFSCHSGWNGTGRGLAIELRAHVASPNDIVHAVPGVGGSYHPVGGFTTVFGPDGAVVRNHAINLPVPGVQR